MISPVRRGLAVAVLVLLVGASNAWADATITAHTPNQFGAAVTTIDQGEKVTFHNLDIVGHDVTSHHTGDNGSPLFSSPLVSPGASAPVEGTEYLTTGSYDFFCSIHPGMEAKLQVTSAGKPVPRPQPEGIAVKVLSKDLDRVVDTGKLKLGVKSRRGSVVVGARAIARKSAIALGSKKLNFERTAEKTVVLNLSDAARKALRKRKSATLIATATASHADGHTERSTARRKLD